MFEDRLRKLRIEKGLTQQEMADILDMPRVTYSNYEANRREPTAVQLKHIAVFFNVSCDYLLGFESNSEPPSPTITQEVIDYMNNFSDLEKHAVKLYCEFIEYRRDKGD